jgi:fatty acid-binding protein DegV
VLYNKVRCKRKGLQRLVSDFEVAARKAIIEKVGIAHVDAAGDAESLRQMLSKVYQGRIIVAEAGPAVGLHIGSGGLALIYY